MVLYKIKTVVVGENKTFMGQEEYLKSQGVHLVYAESEECVQMMAEFTTSRPELWGEDIGLASEQQPASSSSS